jgi:hypothetical protein
MIAPRYDRVVFVAVTQGEVVGVAKTHFHADSEGSSPAGHYLGGGGGRSEVPPTRSRFCPHPGET